METLSIVKTVVAFFLIFVIKDLLKPGVSFGIVYKIKEINKTKVVLINTQNNKEILARKSILFDEEIFQPGDDVQMHSIYTLGEKTIHKLKKV